MNKRENIIAAIRRNNPETVPFAMRLCEIQEEKIMNHFNCTDIHDFFDLPYRVVRLNPTKVSGVYDKYFDNDANDIVINEYGVGHIYSDEVKHFSRMVHPMKDFKSVEEIKEFPLPDLAEDYRYEGLAEKIQSIKDKGLLSVFYSVQVFEPAWYLRSLEALFMDMMDDSPIAVECLERLTVLKEKQCAKIAECGVDMIIFGDDVGTQQALMMSVDMYRKWLKPTMQRCIKAAKDVNPDIIAYYHSDGNVESIIEDLIEIGVDVLNPVQPECMDPIKIKAKYGDRLSFWGTIGTQTTMPFGTVEDVKKDVKNMIETVGKGGGLVIAPSHIIEPEVPLENIIAFFEAVNEYGDY